MVELRYTETETWNGSAWTEVNNIKLQVLYRIAFAFGQTSYCWHYCRRSKEPHQQLMQLQEQLYFGMEQIVD